MYLRETRRTNRDGSVVAYLPLTAERHGRETTYRLAGSFARGFEYLRTQTSAGPPPWDGWFHTVLYRVPEESRGSATRCDVPR